MDKNIDKEWIQNIYWKLEKYSNVLVLRNKLWFNNVVDSIKEVAEIIENEKPSLIPTTYSFNTNKVAAELTDFTQAAEKTVNAVVHVKNTNIQNKKEAK